MHKNITAKLAIKYALVLMCLVLSSCATIGKLKGNDKTDKVEFLVLTSPSINPDVIDRAAPVRLDVFHLQKKSEFIYTNYLELIEDEDNSEDEGAAVESEIIDKSQHMLTPDSLNVIPLEVKSDIKYLGLIVGYRDIEEANWKVALQKQPKRWFGRGNYLYLMVDDAGVVQLSKKEMREELKEYASRHPEDESVTKNGTFKRKKYDYSKGIFNDRQP